MVRDAAVGWVKIATSEVTLVLDDGPQSRAHKVILVPLMPS